MSLKYLVTGTGRCGTVFLARLLTSLGIPCGHEVIFNHDGLEMAKKRIEKLAYRRLSRVSTVDIISGLPLPIWLENVDDIVADSSYMAAPFLKDSLLKEIKIIHLVRNPLKVVNSFLSLGYFQNRFPSSDHPYFYEKFIYSHLPELTENMSSCERACLYYTKWNKMIESDRFWRVEDGIEQFLELLDKKDAENVFSDAKINSFAYNTRVFSINDLPRGKIRSDFIDLGRRYGYSLLQLL